MKRKRKQISENLDIFCCCAYCAVTCKLCLPRQGCEKYRNLINPDIEHQASEAMRYELTEIGRKNAKEIKDAARSRIGHMIRNG